MLKKFVYILILQLFCLFSTAQTLKRYEYWIDDDFSEHVSVKSSQSDQVFTVDVSNVSTGIHYLNYRAYNSDGEVGSIQRFLFYLTESEDESNLPLVGYRYSFNEKSTYVPISETEQYQMSGYQFPVPDILDVAEIDASSKFVIAGDSVSLSRSTTVNFAIQFVNKAGNWSSPESYSYTESDKIVRKAQPIEIQSSLILDKVKSGDFCVIKMSIPSSSTYYLKSSRPCNLGIYDETGKLVTTVSQQNMLNTYSIGLASGEYYGVIYNTTADRKYTDSKIEVRLMLTDNCVPTPEISYANEKVSITCAQKGANIYYTLDGANPTTKSTLYSGAFLLTHNAVIKAMATYSDYANSDVATYTINTYKVEKPTAQFANLKVYLTCSTPDAKIYYTIDGSDPLTNGNLYTEPVSVLGNCKVRAIAKRDYYNNSDELVYNVDVTNVKCVIPVITVNNNVLTITTLTEGAKIYYTLDGTVPATSSTLYSSAVQLTHNCRIRAFAVKEECLNSEVSSEYVVNWFVASKPDIALDGTTLTMTSSTPGNTIYYEFGGTNPTRQSIVYTGPITITDNRVVKAFAVADNFNDSEITTFNTSMFTCEPVQFTFDGRSITMKTATEGAKIHYTVDGSAPTSASPVYSSQIILEGLCTVSAFAMKDDYNDSKSTSYTLPCYYNGDVVYVKDSGNLSKVFGWTSISSVEQMTIDGSLSTTDLTWLASQKQLKHLDMEKVNIEGNSIPAEAFANMNIVSVALPSSLTAVGARIFKDCKSLAAIQWNMSLNVPDDILGGLSLPNMLIYVKNASYVSSKFNNVVANGKADAIILTDDATSNFYCPEQFTARTVSYTHNYSQQTEQNVCKGWESIALPFTVESISHSVKGAASPFAKHAADAKPFWLYSLTSTGFTAASEIEANTPYIISMPNYADYADTYILAGNVTFSASNATVYLSNKVNKPAKGENVFVPNYLHSASADKSVLNVLQQYNGHPEGCMFVPGLRDVKPFEAYVTTTGSQAKIFYISSADEMTSIEEIPVNGEMNIRVTDGKIVINSSCGQTARIYNLSGMLVKVVRLSAGLNYITDIHEGIYIINGKKVNVR